MISRWKIEPCFTEKHQDRYLISVQGDKEDVDKIIQEFNHLCRNSFPLSSQPNEGFNWGFYFFSSEKEDRHRVEKYIKKMAISESDTASPEGKLQNDIADLAQEIGGVIKELTTHGISQKEATEVLKHKDIILPSEIKVPQPESASVPTEVGKIRPLYLKNDENLLEEPLVPHGQLVRIGIVYPEDSREKIKVFLEGLTDIVKTSQYHFFTLDNVFEKKVLSAERVTVKELVELYYHHKLEVLLVFVDRFSDFPECAHLGDILKEMPKKRKIFIKLIQIKKITSRSTFVDLIVDVALLRGRGIGDFQN